MAKGKEHKKYEFGSKASVAMTKDAGVIVVAVAHPENIHDVHTQPEVLEVTEAIRGRRPIKAIVERGYRGRKKVGTTEILPPSKPLKGEARSLKNRMRQRFRRRAAIEPVIGHLKPDFRLSRCYLKGQLGDQLNLLVGAHGVGPAPTDATDLLAPNPRLTATASDPLEVIPINSTGSPLTKRLRGLRLFQGRLCCKPNVIYRP